MALGRDTIFTPVTRFHGYSVGPTSQDRRRLILSGSILAWMSHFLHRVLLRSALVRRLELFRRSRTSFIERTKEES